jgi:hypothetical protein
MLREWVERSPAGRLGVLGGSEGSPKGRKKCIKGRKKLEETCKCVESQAGTKFDFIKPKECLADG